MKSFHRLFLILLSASAAAAQPGTTGKVAIYGAITGHVSCADTNAPARLAAVAVESANDLAAYRTGKNNSTLHVTSVTTLLDGSFLIEKLPPGNYYVIASAPGYLSPLDMVADTQEQLRNPDSIEKEKYEKTIPRVSVQGNLTSQIDVLLERGAAVSGTVRYDDGSPATGLAAKLLVKQKEKWVLFHNGSWNNVSEIRTDDRGNYRIANLPAREYLLQVDLRLEGKTHSNVHPDVVFDVHYGDDPSYSIPIYTGSHFFAKDAKPFSLSQGEERTGEDLQIPLAQLHRVSGNLVAAKDGHVINSGEVELVTAADRTHVESFTLTISASTFDFSFVPEGDYVLHAMGEDVEWINSGTRRDLHGYSPADQAIHIDGDKSGVMISLPEGAASLPSTRSK